MKSSKDFLRSKNKKSLAKQGIRNPMYGISPWNKQPREERYCKNCGNIFKVCVMSLKIFCSRKCAWAFPKSLDTRQKMSLSKKCLLQDKTKHSFYGKKLTDKHKENISKNHADVSGNKNPMFGKTHTDETVQKICKNVLKSGNHPNCVELELSKILDELFFKSYKYVGDGSFMLGRKNPDFIDETNKKIIELFGKIWHKDEDELIRIEYFKKLGYDTLVLWTGGKISRKQRKEFDRRIVKFHIGI